MIHKLLFCSLLSLIFCFGNSGYASAQRISGQDDPAFVAVLELWLSDEEETALPALSNLAQSGNIAARVLIGLIDKNASLQGPWLALLPKQDRIALMRTKGGLSGTSWLRKVESVESIVLWLNILDSKANIDSALKLADLGEARLARAGLIALEARQTRGFLDYADDNRFPVETRYLIWREWQKNGLHMSVSTALSKLDKGDPQRDLLRKNVPYSELENWLMQSDLALPIKALCQNQCPANGGACLRAGMATLGGYRRYATQGSPLVALVSEVDFAASMRGQRSVLRRALAYTFLTEGRLKVIAQIDGCFAQQLADEGQKF